MEDTIDRVFVQALATIRVLSNPKFPSASHMIQRPPLQNRIHLYGLYKQATAGDVDQLMPRPTGNREEDEAGRTKWDAWYSQRGLSKTEAKRQYIPYLLDTMDKFASSTPESRELISELRGLWDQVKDLDSSSDSPIDSPTAENTQIADTLTAQAKDAADDEDRSYSNVEAEQDEQDREQGEQDDEDSESLWRSEVSSTLDELIANATYLKSLLSTMPTLPSSESPRRNLFVTAPSTPSYSLSQLPSLVGLNNLSSFRRGLAASSAESGNSGNGGGDPSWRSLLFYLASKFAHLSKRVALDIALIAAIITLLRWRRNLRRAPDSSRFPTLQVSA